MRLSGFIGPSYTNERSKNIDCQRCMNLYPELHAIGNGKEREVASLLGTPGLRRLVTLGTSPVRGVYTASNGRVFAVGGTKLYELSSSWVATERGTIVSSSGRVSIADNGTNMVLVDGTAVGYALTFADNTFAQISDPDFLGADMVTYQDGYFIFNKRESGQFFISELNAATFDALDIATSEGNPDNLVGLISDHRELWLFNERTTEVFFNSGNADFPFERIQGAFIEHGCAAKFSIAKMDNSTFWLGRNEAGAGVVYMARGYQAERISTHAVEQAIQGYSDMEDAEAFCYQQEGHTFYVLNFPTADTTWVFDSSTHLWHERCYTNDGAFERHRANCHAYAHGVHLVGDYENGKLYQFDTAYYSDDGDAITRLRIAPHISADSNRVIYKHFLLDAEMGVGLDGASTLQGNDPQVMLQFSDDGGHSWSNEQWRSIGKIGNRHKRAKWNRLGASRDRVFKVKITDPVKVVLIGASLELERLAS